MTLSMSTYSAGVTLTLGSSKFCSGCCSRGLGWSSSSSWIYLIRCLTAGRRFLRYGYLTYSASSSFFNSSTLMRFLHIHLLRSCYLGLCFWSSCLRSMLRLSFSSYTISVVLLKRPYSLATSSPCFSLSSICYKLASSSFFRLAYISLSFCPCCAWS